MIRVAISGGQTIELTRKELLEKIQFNSIEVATQTENYLGFQLTTVGFRMGKFYPGPASHFNGYIKAIDNRELNDKLLSENIEALVPGGWTGGNDQVGPGFDCAHAGDITCNLSLENIENLFLYEEIPEDQYEFRIQNPERDSYKSRCWVLEKLKHIAEETLNL